MKLTDKQSNNIQILRGLAILAVVFIHNTPSGIAQVYFRPFLNFSVGLFLFFSGMLSNVNNWNHRKRILKVVIPYILWTMIYVIMGNYRVLHEIPIIFLKKLITGNAAAVMYYIFVYCEFTLLIPVIDKLARSKYKYIGFLITPIEIIFMRLIPMIKGYELNKYLEVIMGISCLGWFSYYYFGYLIGNNLLNIKIKGTNTLCLYVISTAFQVWGGYWYFSMGEINCGTQLKLSSILSGIIFAVMSYEFVNSNKFNLKILRLLGDNSFGIYFSHLAVMSVLGQIPFYSEYIFYPVNAIIAVFVSLLCVLVGKKILGRYAQYLAL